jgi:hypothetical protein
MDRRILLRAAGVAGAVFLAGCTGGNSPDDAGSTSPSTPTPTDSPTDSPTPSPTPKATLADQSFEVTTVDCGTTGNSAEATVEGDQVVVTGITDAPDPCHSARLAEAETGCSDGALRVAVETFVPQENEDKVCTQCIAEVVYEARFTFEGTLPRRLVVRHDGERIAESEIGG